MLIAALADIHGNLPALEAALTEIKRLGADRLLVLGDIVVGGPDSLACWERVKALGCPVLRGNHERYVFDLNSERAPPEWRTRRFGPVQYAAAQLGEERRRELAALPIWLTLPEAPDVLFTHGSPRNDNDLVFPYTSDEELVPMFAGFEQPWILRGHNHFAGVRLWGARKIVTVGSVGLPLDGKPGAQFTTLRQTDAGWAVQHRLVRYDLGAALRRFSESGYLKEAGPMARLYYREVASGAFQIIPFLQHYTRWQQRDPKLSLDAAVARFCGDAW